MIDSISTRKFIKNNEWPVHFSYLLLCLGALCASFVMSTNGSVNSLHLLDKSLPIFAPCFLRLLTGYRCPACGMTRAFIYMSHFNPSTAFSMNPGGVMFYMLCIFEVPYRAVLLLKGKIALARFFKTFELTLFIATGIVTAVFFLSQFI
jgi:hypothetical protein